MGEPSNNPVVKELREVAEVLPGEEEKSPESLTVSGPIALGILVHESQKQILKRESDNMTVAIVKRKEGRSANQIALKQKLVEDAKKENEAVKKKLTVLTENRKVVEESVESDENITKQLMDGMQHLQGTSKGLIEGYKRFDKKTEELQDKLLKVKELTASIAAKKKRYQEIEKKKAELKSVKDKNPLIHEEINKHEGEFVKKKNISDAEAVNIQNLKDKKLEMSNTLLSKREQLTDLTNQISNEENKLSLKSTLQRTLEEKSAKIEEWKLILSKSDEEIALLRKQEEENSTTSNNNVITVEKLEGSIEVMKKKVETAKCAMEKVVQKISEDKKTSKDRYEVLKNHLMKLNEESDEKHKILKKSREDIVSLIEKKTSLHTQFTNQQTNEEVKVLAKRHLEYRQKYLEEIVESRQKVMKRQEEFQDHSAIALSKIMKEKDDLIANITCTNDMQKNLKETIENKKLIQAKLIQENETIDKNIAEMNKKVKVLKERILKRKKDSVRPGLKMGPPTTTQKRVSFEKRLSETSTATDSSSIMSDAEPTPIKKLLKELKKRGCK